MTLCVCAVDLQLVLQVRAVPGALLAWADPESTDDLRAAYQTAVLVSAAPSPHLSKWATVLFSACLSLLTRYNMILFSHVFVWMRHVAGRLRMEAPLLYWQARHLCVSMDYSHKPWKCLHRAWPLTCRRLSRRKTSWRWFVYHLFIYFCCLKQGMLTWVLDRGRWIIYHTKKNVPVPVDIFDDKFYGCSRVSLLSSLEGTCHCTTVWNACTQCRCHVIVVLVYMYNILSYAYVYWHFARVTLTVTDLHHKAVRVPLSPLLRSLTTTFLYHYGQH